MAGTELESAEAWFNWTTDRIEVLAQANADGFRRAVLQPFCERHNLRFWSGMGTWFFESAGAVKLEDPDDLIEQWAISAGHAELRENPRFLSGQGWVVTCDDSEIPEFFLKLRAIHEFLSRDYMGGCFGYWVSDYCPPKVHQLQSR